MIKPQLSLLTVLAVFGAARGEAQTVSYAQALLRPETSTGEVLLLRPAKIVVHDTPLAEALALLAQRSGVPFAFSASLLPDQTPWVDCACQTATVAEALDQLLGDTDLVFRQLHGRVVVFPPAQPVLDRLLATADWPQVRFPNARPPFKPSNLLVDQEGTISGEVVEASTLRPLAGAQVSVLGTGLGTLTNGEGRYRLPDVPAGEVTVRVQMIGYGTEESTVTLRAGQSVALNFELAQQALALDEIVVTGTAGAAERREIGNSISTVTAEELRSRPIRNMDDALRSAGAGMGVYAGSAAPGAGAAVRIRGANSITQGNAPLIYVDGVRIYNGDYRQSKGGPFQNLSTAGTPGQVSSALNDIAPEDVARIEVIKGPAATTLYGTEASGGVIHIITKSGRALQRDTTIWSMHITQGIGYLPTQWGPGGRPSDAWFDTYGSESKGIWVDQWLGRAYRQDYSLSARGQRGDAGYYISGRWNRDQGVLPKQGAEEWGLRANTSFTISDLTVRFSNSLSRRNVDWISGRSEAEGFLLQVMRGPFDYTNNQDGRALQIDYNDSQTHWISGLDLSYAPTTALEIRALLGFDYVDQEYVTVAPFGSWFVPEGERGVRRFRNETRTLDFRTTYRAGVGGISTNTSFGFEIFDNQIKGVQGIASRFAGPHDPTLASGAIRNVVENQLREVNAGFFVQELLGFGDRFFLTAGLRVDGNSSFGDDFGLQTYPKLSGSYIISDEDLWPEFFDMTKLRAAYGESGRAPGFFDAEKVWAPVRAKEGEAGVTPENLGNPELGPERSREIEFGIETSALDGRLGLDLSYYYQRTMDALIPVEQDPSLGFLGSQLLNVGTLDNWGVEVDVITEPLRTRNISWQVGFTLSTNNSEVKDLGGSPPISLPSRGHLWIREGFPVGAWFGEKVTNPNEFAEPEFAQDANPLFGNTVFLGPVYPTMMWGINTSLRLGDNLRISARGDYRGGHRMFSRTAEANTQRMTWPACFDAQQQIAAGNLSQVTALDRVRCSFTVPKGPVTSDASFFKLREVMVSYNVPEPWLPGPFSSLDLSLSATNLLTITDYWGIDPEILSVGSERGFSREEEYTLPPLRRFNFSIRTSF